MSEAALSLEPFLSQIRYASAVFGPQGILVNSSPKFTTLFAPDKGHASYDALFAKSPILVGRIAQVYAEKNPFTLYDTEVLSDSDEGPFNAEVFPLIDADKEFQGVAVNLFETRDRSLFSEQKKRHDALARMGLIASGLAHEIKNPLAGLKGAAQLILSDVDGKSALADYARIIAKESERINRLVEELLDFTRPKELKFAKINIHKVLHDVVETQKFASAGKVLFKEVFDPSLPEILGDEDALKQIFLNLVKNAVEAVAKGGAVKIKSQFVTDFVVKRPGKKQQIICVQIEDDGRGMTEEQIKNIFTPYYSTKDKGTGLGLAIVNQLVELHGGSVTVKSKPGEGAVFSIYLPV